MKNWKSTFINFPKTGSGKKNGVDVNKFGVAASVAYGTTKQAKNRRAKSIGYAIDYANSSSDIYTLVDETNKSVIYSVAGTRTNQKKHAMKDLKEDMLIIAGLDRFGSRPKEVSDVILNAQKKYKNYDETITGHSLGAKIAKTISERTHIPAIVFSMGSSPMSVISDRVAKMFSRDLGGDIKHYSVKGDLLSVSERKFGNTEHIDIPKKNDVNAHDLRNYHIGEGKGTKATPIDLTGPQYNDDDDEWDLPEEFPKPRKKSFLDALDGIDIKMKKRYKSEEHLRLLFFYKILKRNGVDCWLRNPKDGDSVIIWESPEHLKNNSGILTIFGLPKAQGKRLLKNLLGECLKKANEQFAVIYVSLRSPFFAHANLIVVNLNTKEAYRYDPEGMNLPDAKTIFEPFDHEMLGLFASIGFSYKSAEEVCPDVGIQLVAKNKKKDDGFCQMWSGLFLDVQLRNPNKTVVEVEEIIKQKYDTPKKLGMAIKKIASYIQQKKDAKYSTDLDTYTNQMNEKFKKR